MIVPKIDIVSGFFEYSEKTGIVVTILSTAAVVAAYVPMEEWLRIVVAFSGFVPGLVGIFYAVKIEQVAGYYECQYCKNKYVPTFKAVTLAPHMGRTRYMRCPECHKKSWQKKVISKD